MIEKRRRKVDWKPRRLQEPDERMTVFDDESDVLDSMNWMR